jgi:histidinol-phosphatase (PHP family)
VSLQADSHVHTQFSWDAPRGDMEATCRRALEIGLPAICFADHADFVEGVHEGMRAVDIEAYLVELERCRGLFPSLRILSGVELGEPHRFHEETRRLLGAGPIDRILGSVHCISWQGRLLDASQMKQLAPEHAPAFMRAYLDEIVVLADSPEPFGVLAHLDYPKRYWPQERVPFDERDYEGRYREALRALAARGGALEVNTTRGAEPTRGLCPGRVALRWWAEEGGRAVSFGSDAHDPSKLAEGFRLAGQLVEAAGFRSNDDPVGFWLR